MDKLIKSTRQEIMEEIAIARLKPNHIETVATHTPSTSPKIDRSEVLKTIALYTTILASLWGFAVVMTSI